MWQLPWPMKEFGMTTSVANLMEDDMVVSNIKKQVCDVLDGFLSLLTKYIKKKPHNKLFLMLNPKFKAFKLVHSFIDLKQTNAMVKL
jgi:hypothetical protein